MRCESVGIRHVTPWLWLGGGYRRVVVPGRPGGGSGDMLWDYSLACASDGPARIKFSLSFAALALVITHQSCLTLTRDRRWKQTRG